MKQVPQCPNLADEPTRQYCSPRRAHLKLLTQRRALPNRFLHIHHLPRHHLHELHLQPRQLEVRTLRHIRHITHQRASDLQLDHLRRALQLGVQPHHLLNRQPLLHRLLQRNPHPRRRRHPKRALHLHHHGPEVRLPLLQRQMRLQRHPIHRRSIHQQAQILPQQLDQRQRGDIVNSARWGRGHRRGRRGRYPRGRRFRELELRGRCHAVHRWRGGRTGVLQFGQRAAGRPGHDRVRCDAGGGFLQLRV